MDEAPQPRDVLIPFGIFVAIMLVTIMSPPLGLILGMLIPVPLILVYLSHGKPAGIASIAGVFVVLWLLGGAEQALMFGVSYATLAVVMAESIRLGFSFPKPVVFGAIASFVLSAGLLVLVFSGKEVGPTEFFHQQIRQNAEQSLKSFEATGAKPEELAAMKDMADRYSKTMAVAFPGFMAVATLMAAVANFVLVRVLWLKYYRREYFKDSSVAEWYPSDQMVWGLIAAGISSLLMSGPVQVIGLNVLMVMLALYFFQGLIICHHFFRTRRVPMFLVLVFYILMFILPHLMGVVLGAGVFDIWVDFRKVRPVASPPGNPDDYSDS